MSKSNDSVPRQEGYLVEFKELSGRISVNELAITLCAFANTEGGVVYLGVTDSTKTVGVAVTPRLLDDVRNAAREQCSPPVPIDLRQIPVLDSGGARHVLAIRTEKTNQLHSVASGRSYIRVGTQDKRVLGDELLRLAESKSQVSFEEQLLDAGLEAIDSAALEEYYNARRALSSIGQRLQAGPLLQKMGLAEPHQGKLRIKAGAYILFGRGDRDLILQREFTFVRYQADGQLIAYREDIRLPALQMIQRLMELIRPHNWLGAEIRGIQRSEPLRYPEPALREALLNAFAHRDYRIAGLRNECRLYPDRIEIRSAGGLPSFVTLETLGDRHYSRNPKIMHALLVLGLVEELGQGIALIKGALAQNGNPPPDFRASRDQVTVVFQAPALEARDIRRTLDQFFQSHRTATRKQIEAVLGIKSTRAKKLIAELVESGYLERLGAARSTHYVRRS